MFVRIPGLGSTGVIHDTVGEAITSGAWTDALNVRFTGVELKKMLEPSILAVWDDETQGEPIWMQHWADGLTTYLAVATGAALWLYKNNGIDPPTWEDASRPTGYNTDGYWDSFAWGDTCIFNNGVDTPQIFNQNTAQFEDLPEWGLISTATNILNNEPASKQEQVSCVKLIPYKSFLVAIGVTQNGLYQPNKIWWSDTTNLAGYEGAPNWDYETPASLSGQIVIDPEGGAITTGAVLNEQLIIYTSGGATAMQFTGGALVMAFRRLFQKGAAGLHCVAEVQNQHFVVSQDTIYIHDGSTVVNNLIAKDRVENEFFKRIGKGGRFGDGSVQWDGLQVVKNPDRKEIVISYTDSGQGTGTPEYPVCDPVEITTQPTDQNGGSGTVTFTVFAEGTETITYQWYRDGQVMTGETGHQLTVFDTTISKYYVTVQNPCGSQQSNVVEVVPSDVCVPVMITQQPVDYNIPVEACQALDLAFKEFDGELWFMYRGYSIDVTGVPSGEYSGGIPNMATNPIMPSDGQARNLYPTDRISVGWNNCSDENINRYNGNNTGSGSNINHIRGTDVTPNYFGAVDAFTQGTCMLAGYDSTNPNAAGAKQLARCSFPTFTINNHSINWYPTDGRVAIEYGDSNDLNDIVRITLPSDSNFLGYDYDNPDPATNRIWRFLAWKVQRTNSSLSFKVWKDGVYAGEFTTTTTLGGATISSRSWWELDDDPLNTGDRSFVWGGGNFDGVTYRPWYLLYSFCAPLSFNEAHFADIQAALDLQLGRT